LRGTPVNYLVSLPPKGDRVDNNVYLFIP
jgi:hypothetical protein